MSSASGRRGHDLRHDSRGKMATLASSSFEAALRIAPVGGAARLLVHAGRDHDQVGALQIAVRPVPKRRLSPRTGAPVSHVQCHRLGPRAGPVHQHDLAAPSPRCIIAIAQAEPTAARNR